MVPMTILRQAPDLGFGLCTEYMPRSFQLAGMHSEIAGKGDSVRLPRVEKAVR